MYPPQRKGKPSMDISQGCRIMSEISVPGRLRQEDPEYKTGLGYLVRSRQGWAAWNPIKKKKKEGRKRKRCQDQNQADLQYLLNQSAHHTSLEICEISKLNRWWWCTPLMLTLGRQSLWLQRIHLQRLENFNSLFQSPENCLLAYYLSRTLTSSFFFFFSSKMSWSFLWHMTSNL